MCYEDVLFQIRDYEKPKAILILAYSCEGICPELSIKEIINLLGLLWQKAKTWAAKHIIYFRATLMAGNVR